MNNDLTIVMITKNEEYHIKEAIEGALNVAASVIVVDSGSTDNTVAIAIELGAKVIFKPFRSFGEQWNYAASHSDIKTKWVMKLDPDERINSQLANELCNLNESFNGFYIDRRLWFMGAPLPIYDKVLRIWKRGKCNFTNNLVNEHPVVIGSIGALTGTIEHLDSQDLSHWIDKQNRYTTFEALSRWQNKHLAFEPNFWGDKRERNAFFKSVFLKVPFRYQINFILLLFKVKIWISGSRGFNWALQRSWARRMVELKLNEIKQKGEYDG